MKNFPFIKVAFLIGAVLSVNVTSAQLLALNKTEENRMDSNLIYTKGSLEAALDTRDHHFRNPRILAHFTKNYIDVAKLKWYIISDGMLAKFNKDEIQHTVAYDPDGYWKRTIKYYPAAHIPLELINTVKKRFADFTIIRSWEITSSKTNQSVYLVQAQKGNLVNELRVSKGKTSVIRKIHLKDTIKPQ